MRKRTTWISAPAVLVLISVAAASLAQGNIGIAIDGDPPTQKGGKMSGDWNLSGPTSRIRALRFVVIHNKTDFTTLWKEFQPNPDATMPEIDFAKKDVVAFFAGGKPTGGYSASISKITLSKDGKSADVEVLVAKPGPGTITTQAFTFPYTLKAVDKLPKTVTHKIVEAPPAK